ncbi:MAG TPA: Ig-like domain repeat protein [Thermoanaerobaculia bacterium]|nr:Ig-like domain repeat protein [Thermoanaerobaculia bacterium]
MALAQTPAAGQNVNMVSGTSWPGGDPFLQRQNEPSIAVSSRNPLHLLAGANDYRTVDLPVSDTVPGSLAGDAWLGVFKSYDGGLTWQSYLLSGYPQDNSQPPSPLKAYSAAADPTVRAGTGGVFYYSGIAFNRGTNNGTVFVSTFFDTNQKENGSAPVGKDAIQFQGTVLVDGGTSGQFLDKTWIATDIPRAGNGTCTFNAFGQSQTIKAGNVYMVWSRFTGSQSTKIMFSRSLDCGKTWSNPIKLSESSSINQGTNVAIDPTSGKVYVAWRQFATTSNPDSILIARSDDFGATFPSKNTTQVATLTPFDQPLGGTRFRTNALPSIAVSVDSAGNSRVHVVWAQRTGTSQDARIVMSTSSNAGKTWSNPAVIDAFGGPAASGHQFMPQITFAAGRLMVLYYDQRFDHTLALFQPQDSPFLGLYNRTQAPRGELLLTGGAAMVFTPYVDDDPTVLPKRRHTIDLRVAEALPAATPVFTSTLVSQYRMGLWAPDASGIYRDDENNPISPQPPDHLYQLQVNAPNLPMFSLGTLPFLGDYIDIAGQNFVTDSAGNWLFNTSASSPPVFYATWTDNRDVVPPMDPATGLVDWTKYTPPISATNAGNGTSTSILDPTQTVPQCQPIYTGSRNQNIYMSRVTEGLLVGSPQDAKPLSPTLQRAFVVTLQNLTKDIRTFHLSIAAQPPGGQASFLQASLMTGFDVTIPGGSGAARPIFATSSNPAASIQVNVTESGANSIGLSGSIVLNPEGSVTPLVQPDGSVVSIGGVEVYTPSFAVWNPSNPNPYVNISDPNAALQNISNQNISNQNISNADPAIQNISNQNISNQNISNQNISNQNISNASPAIQNISNQNISNQNISNTTVANQNISNQNISNQNISNQNISNTPITDATYAVTNMGNTTHSYRVALYGNNPNHTPLQVIVTKNSATPTAVGCTLQSVPQSIALARADAAVITTTLPDATAPNIDIGDVTNATVPIAPGETVFLTLRGALTADQMTTLTRSLTPVITAHGANTGGAGSDFALLLSIQTAGGTLPAAVVGTPYSATLQSVGGTGAITWTILSGSLPGGLTLSGNVISGTPSAAGSFTFTLQAADSSSPPQVATQTLTINVSGRQTAASLSLSPAAIPATGASTATMTVTDNEPTGAASVPSGTVAVTGTGGATGGNCLLAPTGNPNQSSCQVPVTAPAAGSDTITGTYAGSNVHQGNSASSTLTVSSLTTSTSVSLSSSMATVGQAVTVTATVVNTSAGVTTTPTGTVSFSSSIPTDTFSPASCALVAAGTATASCSVSVTAASASPHVISASYAGVSGVFQASGGNAALSVNTRSTTTAVSVSPSPLLAGQAGTVTVSVTDVDAAGTKGSPAGTVSFSSTAAGDSFTPSASCTLVPGTPTSTCSVALSGGAVGNRTVSASYAGSGAYTASGSSTPLLVRGNTVTAITGDSPAPSGQGLPVTVSFTVAPAAPATGTPTGTVTVADGFGASCVATLPSASCALSPSTAGTVTLTATYSGDVNFSGSSGTRSHTVIAPYNFIGFISPLTTAGTLAAPSNSGSGNFSKGLPIKWQLKDSSGNFLTNLTTTQTLSATYYAGGVCTSGQATGTTFLLYQPTQGATGGSTFRYDPNTNQFLFNWSTTKVTTGPGCYEIILQLNDGSTPKATRINLQ